MSSIFASRRGSVATIAALAAVPLIAAAGLATDAARGYLVKSRLSQALDAAALAGARVIFSPTRDGDVAMYFHANFPAGYMGATVNDPTVSTDPTNEVLTLTATATVPTTFMRVLGLETVTVQASTEVTRETSALDVVLSIDISGSMTESAGGGVSRITAAKNAAKSLVSILFGADAIKDHLRIGLVPWNSKVKVALNGVSFNSSLTTTQAVPAFINPLNGLAQNQIFFANNSPVPLLSAPPSNWRGCVYQRYIHDGNTTNDADTQLGAVVTPSGTWAGWQPIGPEGEPVSGFARCALSIGGQECKPCPSRGITPLINVRTSIDNAINALSAADNTNIPQGLYWAWDTLMPGVPFTEGVPPLEGRFTRAIVLLTDGQNVGGSGDGYKGVFGLGEDAEEPMNARLLELAANIKASGVLIYTIQFGDEGTEGLMQEVATKPFAPFYHFAPDAAALSLVFKEISNHLSELRVSR